MSVSIRKIRSRRANGHTRKCCRNNPRPRPPPNGLDCGRGHLRENGKAKLIPFLGAAHEGCKLGGDQVSRRVVGRCIVIISERAAAIDAIAEGLEATHPSAPARQCSATLLSSI